MEFDKNIRIGNKYISENSPTFIVAEAGVNHNGDMTIAKKMVDVAAASGVDAIKFQSFKTDDLILNCVDKAYYQKNVTSADETQYQMLKKLELSLENMMDLREYSEKKGLIFLSTPFEKNSLDELDIIGIDAFKIASTDVTNIKYLREVAGKGKPIILSTGMCCMNEIELALDTIHKINNKVILLQCTSNYPIDDSEANLNVINTFSSRFDILVGYSDHSIGVGASPYAVAMGAKIIEKHFTLDRNMDGPDQKASIIPRELKQLVKDIRQCEKYLGCYEKKLTASEYSNKISLQKCLVASRRIMNGEKFTQDNIEAKRTNGVGISAINFDKVINMYSNREYKKNDIIDVCL